MNMLKMQKEQNQEDEGVAEGWERALYLLRKIKQKLEDLEVMKNV